MSDESDMHALTAAAAAKLGPFDGHVRDFIKIPTRWLGNRELWPWVFNVADMLLVGGVGVLAFRLFFDREPRRQATAKADLDAAGSSS